MGPEQDFLFYYGGDKKKKLKLLVPIFTYTYNIYSNILEISLYIFPSHINMSFLSCPITLYILFNNKIKFSKQF